MPKTVYPVLKTLLVSLSTLIASFSPVVGGMMYPVGEGSTRVRLSWHGMTGDFLVNVESVGCCAQKLK